MEKLLMFLEKKLIVLGEIATLDALISRPAYPGQAGPAMAGPLLLSRYRHAYLRASPDRSHRSGTFAKHSVNGTM